MTRWHWTALALAAFGIVALTLALGIVLGRGCDPVIVQPVGIDAGPGDRAIAAELDASLRREDERIARLEAQHAAEIAAFSARETAEWDRMRATGDRKQLARWLRERSRRLLIDGGR